MSLTASIEELIPHRSPFIFVDSIELATKEEIIGVKTFTTSNEQLKGSFPEFDFVPGMILVESMAQCGGAGIKILGIADGLFGLAGIDNVTFLKGVTYDTPIRYVIKNIRTGEKLIKQSGVAYVNEQPVLEASWTCVKLS